MLSVLFFPKNLALRYFVKSDNAYEALCKSCNRKVRFYNGYPSDFPCKETEARGGRGEMQAPNHSSSTQPRWWSVPSAPSFCSRCPAPTPEALDPEAQEAGARPGGVFPDLGRLARTDLPSPRPAQAEPGLLIRLSCCQLLPSKAPPLRLGQRGCFIP